MLELTTNASLTIDELDPKYKGVYSLQSSKVKQKTWYQNSNRMSLYWIDVEDGYWAVIKKIVEI